MVKIHADRRKRRETSSNGTLPVRPGVPDNPIIPYIEGDGVGPDIWSATKTVLDAAVESSYKGAKRYSGRSFWQGKRPRSTTAPGISCP